MVIARSWYVNAFEHVSGVTINFNPYDTDPQTQSGGAISLSGQFDLPDDGARASRMVYELNHGIGNAVQFQPVPSGWWTTGRWNTAVVDPLSIQLNLDQCELDSFDRTATVTLLSWDGTNQEIRSDDDIIARSVVGMLNKLGTAAGVPFYPSSDIQAAPYAGVAWPQLQGAMADVLKQISGGLGINISYSPATQGVVGTVTAAKPRIRLINPMHSKRKIIRPQFVPEVRVACYNTFQTVNKVIYAAPDVIQVVSGEDQEIRTQLQGTPIFSTLVQPTVVAGIPNIPYTGPASPYCVYDSDGYEANIAWRQGGGKITVASGGTPDELVIKIHAPFDVTNPTATYTIAEGENAAFYVTAGDAVNFTKLDSSFYSGAVSSATAFRPANYEPPYLDNPVVASNNLMYSRAVAFVAQATEPLLTIDEVSFQGAVQHDRITGVESTADPATVASGVFKAQGAMWRFTKLSYDQQTNSYSGSASESTTCADFDAEFGNLTLLQYQQYLAGVYPDATVPSFGTGAGRFPVGTPLDPALASLTSPPLEQWGFEPLRMEQS